MSWRSRVSDFRAGMIPVLMLPGLTAQETDNRVAVDGRSGTVVLRFDDDLRRSYGFTNADFGLVKGEFGIHNQNSQLLVANTPEGGDEFYVGWQDGEVARALDLGTLPAVAPFDRINFNEVVQRFQGPLRAVKRLSVRSDHVYLIAIDNPVHAEHLVLPGDPMLVKVQVIGHVTGKSVSLRWAILNEPFGGISLADGAFDVRLLPRLPPSNDTTVAERQLIERLVAQVGAGSDVDGATAKLMDFGHKVLPLAVNHLLLLDRRLQDDVDAAWQIDALLKVLTGGPREPLYHPKAEHMLEQHTVMVCRWYSAARRYRTAEQWDAALAALKSPKRR